MDRNRTLNDLETGMYDLLVVGGGITGAGVAREASLRGYRVVLVEARDFASGTSSRATKLIHGGLRYLKQFDFKLVAESVRERQLLLRMAPQLVEATPFLFPVYRGDPDSLLALRAGLTLYDLFARFQAAVPHRMLSPRDVLDVEAGLRWSGLIGGALYTDSRTDDSRLTLSVLESASRQGAAVANYLELDEFVHRPNGRVAGARVRDSLTGQRFEVRARRVLTAAGPWADAVRHLDDPLAEPILRMTRGVHLTVQHDRLPLRNAVVMRSADRERRMMFAIPRGSYTYLGTTDTDFEGDPASVRVQMQDVAYILDAANGWFPSAKLGDSDVVSTWAGLRPLIRPRGNASPSSVSRDYQLFRGASGLWTVGGGKLTAFRAMADHIVNKLLPGSGGPAERAASVAALPGGDGHLPTAADWSLLAGRTNTTAERLQEWCGMYGSNLSQVAERLPSDLSGDADLDWHRAMTRYSVELEMAQHLEDVYRRRTDLMLFSPDNGRAMLRPLANEMAALLGWSAERISEEVQRTQAAIDAMFAYRGADSVELRRAA
jgi:glycerol-3-phosphate dehydrogenase